MKKIIIVISFLFLILPYFIGNTIKKEIDKKVMSLNTDSFYVINKENVTDTGSGVKISFSIKQSVKQKIYVVLSSNEFEINTMIEDFDGTIIYQDEVLEIDNIDDYSTNGEKYVYAIILGEPSYITNNYLYTHTNMRDTNGPSYDTDQVNLIAYNDTLLTAEEIRDILYVTDDYSSYEDIEMVFINDEYTSNYNVLGNHIIDIVLYDSVGNSTELSVNVFVRKRQAPTIQTESGYTVCDINAPFTLLELKGLFQAKDEYNNDLTDMITFETDYPEQVILGTYYITGRIEDKYGNCSSSKITVYVIDKDAPYATNLEITINNLKEYSNDELIELIDFKDNYDEDLTIAILEDDYFLHGESAGTFHIKYEVKDKSDNKSIIEVTINCQDNICPTISDYIFTTTTTNKLSSTDILNGLTIKDETTTDLNITIDMQNYINNYNKDGVYDVLVTVYDEALNKTEKIVKVDVYDNVCPILFYDDKIVITSDLTITREQLISFLNSINKDINKVSSTIESSYFTSPNVCNEYSALVTTTKSEEEIKNYYTIKVIDKEENKVSNVTHKKKSFLKKIKDFFLKIFRAIARFFKKLF